MDNGNVENTKVAALTEEGTAVIQKCRKITVVKGRHRKADQNGSSLKISWHSNANVMSPPPSILLPVTVTELNHVHIPSP